MGARVATQKLDTNASARWNGLIRTVELPQVHARKDHAKTTVRKRVLLDVKFY